jgi:hypothetical protein
MQEVLDTCDYLACFSVQTTIKVDRGGCPPALQAKIDNSSFGMGSAIYGTVEGLDEGLESAVVGAEAAGSFIFPRIVEMDWCVYNLKDSKVEVDQTLIVRPGLD